jgi:hypothetical protein
MPPDGSAGIRGGDKLGAALRDAATALGGNPKLKVGFLAGADYPDGTPVAAIAAINEYGARIEREPSETTVYRKVNAKGTEFLRNGKFVKKRASNFASTHYVGAYVITIPPRPFFRTMIAENKGDWPVEMAARLKKNKLDGVKTLKQMGELIEGQLKASIIAMNEPPNAPSTIAKKGAAKPLVDTGHMLNSTGYEVTGQ